MTSKTSCFDHAIFRRSLRRTLPLWKGLNQVISDYLDHITIADLMQQGTEGDDYII